MILNIPEDIIISNSLKQTFIEVCILGQGEFTRDTLCLKSSLPELQKAFEVWSNQANISLTWRITSRFSTSRCLRPSGRTSSQLSKTAAFPRRPSFLPTSPSSPIFALEAFSSPYSKEPISYPIEFTTLTDFSNGTGGRGFRHSASCPNIEPWRDGLLPLHGSVNALYVAIMLSVSITGDPHWGSSPQRQRDRNNTFFSVFFFVLFTPPIV